MKIREVIAEGPMTAAGGVARNAGFGVGALAGSAVRAKKGFDQGYDAVKQAFAGFGGNRSNPLKSSDKPAVNKKPVLNKVYHGELLSQDEINQLQKLKQGLEDGSITTQQDARDLMQALDTAISGSRVSKDQLDLLMKFKREV